MRPGHDSALKTAERNSKWLDVSRPKKGPNSGACKPSLVMYAPM